MKKILVILPIVGLLFSFILYKKFSGKDKRGKEKAITEKVYDGKVYLQFEKLPPNILARSGEFEVTEKQVESLAPYQSLKSKERDILFILMYKQFVAANDETVPEFEVSFKKTSRAPDSLLNQYGIPAKAKTKIEFRAFDEKKGLARIGKKYIQRKDIDFNNYIWASFHTEFFHYQVQAIDKILKRAILVEEAKKLNLNIQQYLEKHVYEKLPKEITAADVQGYLKRYNMDDSEKTRASAKMRLLEHRKKRGLDYILEKYVMKLPVLVNLQPPSFALEAKDDWTPRFGSATGGLALTVFSDTRNAVSQKLLIELLDLALRYKNLKINYRPHFFKEDISQDITSQMHFCVWMSNPDRFYDYFKETLGDFKNDTEKTLYDKADEMDLDIDSLKKCLVSKQYKEVVDYHLKYADYLGIHAGPVVFVDGEVLQGSIPIDAIEAIIHRKLEIASAGVW